MPVRLLQVLLLVKHRPLFQATKLRPPRAAGTSVGVAPQSVGGCTATQLARLCGRELHNKSALPLTVSGTGGGCGEAVLWPVTVVSKRSARLASGGKQQPLEMMQARRPHNSTQVLGCTGDGVAFQTQDLDTVNLPSGERCDPGTHCFLAQKASTGF